jgi:Asp-tRNA(Asn)/Glu-tRNA(Gln) amidotransferase A subunit family amidase
MIVPSELGIQAALHCMRDGELTARELMESCLERIHALEGSVRAWVEVYEKEALEAARRCDDAFQAERWQGDLHGIPMGVKDIIHVKGMWTRYGTSAYPPHMADADAPAVKRLKNAGAIIIGKTETTPLANNDPAITRNPWNLKHTPGGSSSGSAAAVAARMCLAALGTQTGGSLLRPAAYNGLVGFKPTYGYISSEGVMPNSWSMDTVGFHTRCVDDASILWRGMRESNPVPFARIPTPRKTTRKEMNGPYPRLGYIREFFEKETSSEVLTNLESVRERFKAAGAAVVELKLPPSFEYVIDGWDTIKFTELSAYHRPVFMTHHDQFPPKVKDRIETGLKIPGYKYVEALRQRIAFQEELRECLESVDAVLMPVAYSTAPQGLGSTGSSIFNRPWTYSGFPAMSIPCGVDQNGLPFAVQLAAQPMAEDRLLAVSAWCESVLGFDADPLARDI